MADLSGIGKTMGVESRNKPLGCTIAGANQGKSTSIWVCMNTDCHAYGKWWCAFTGW
jgi:hypothetical protein